MENITNIIAKLDTDENAETWGNHRQPLEWAYDLLDRAGVKGYVELEVAYDELKTRWNKRRNRDVPFPKTAAGLVYVETVAGIISDSVTVTTFDHEGNWTALSYPNQLWFWDYIHTVSQRSINAVYVRHTTLDGVEIVTPWLESDPYKYREQRLRYQY